MLKDQWHFNVSVNRLSEPNPTPSCSDIQIILPQQLPISLYDRGFKHYNDVRNLEIGTCVPIQTIQLRDTLSSGTYPKVMRSIKNENPYFVEFKLKANLTSIHSHITILK